MKRIYLSLLMFVALVGNFMATAQRADYNVIPLPKEVKADSVQSFVLREGMGIYFDATNPENIRNAQFLCEWVEEMTGIKLALTPQDKKAAIRMTIGHPADKKLKKGESAPEFTEQEKEAYVITVVKHGVSDLTSVTVKTRHILSKVITSASIVMLRLSSTQLSSSQFTAAQVRVLLMHTSMRYAHVQASATQVQTSSLSSRSVT